MTLIQKKIGFSAGRRSLALCVCLFSVFFFGLYPAAFAAEEEEAVEIVDPVRNSDSYSAVLYNNTNGLPTSEANAIAETSDGFIWIGSYSGLIRYDGDTFERLDASTGISNVVSLYVDSKDRLWIGTNDSGLAVMENGTFRRWTMADGLRASKVSAITEDDQGTIYAGTTGGLEMITPDMELVHLDDPRMADSYIDVLRRGKHGLIYGVTNRDDLFTIRNGKLVRYLSHEKFNIEGVLYVYPDEEHRDYMYIGTGDSNFYYGQLKHDFAITKHMDISPLSSVLYIEKINDQIWICARNGIGVIDGSGFHVFPDLPLNNSVGGMMTDYEGNLWFTSTRQGVMKIVPNKFIDIFGRYGIPSEVVNTTCLYDGKLFIGSDTGLIILDEETGVVGEYPVTKAQTASGADLGDNDLLTLMRGSRIRSIIRDSQERLWLCTTRSRGLFCLDHGTVTAYTEEDGLFSDHVRTVCELPDGGTALANSGGVCVLRDGKVAEKYGVADGIRNSEILTVCASFSGDILCGSNGDGIYVINDDGLRNIGTEDGLSSGIIMRIIPDEMHDVYWLVTSNSIAYMDPDYKVTTVTEFPYSNNFDIYENSRGDLWVLSSNGIYAAPAEQLLANKNISPVHYSMANGLPAIATSNSYSELTPEGDLYIAGNSGVAKVNIETASEDVVSLKVSVPYVDADGKRIMPDEAGNFTIPAETQKLTVYSYVFTYSLTDPLVTYYLDGFEREPVTVRRSQLAPAGYTNLPGGTYRFVITLNDSFGLEGRTETVTIVKKKALWEEPLFYIVAFAAGLVLFMDLNRRLLNRRTRILEEKHREEVEKERLNTELKTASQIQGSMLPHIFPPFPDRTEFDIYATMDPAREVGGDFYDFYMIDDDHLALVIADVSGKGIPASLLMMTSMVMLRNFAKLGHTPSEILMMTNETLCASNQAEMFVTVWMGILDLNTGKITAANAGHEYPALMKDGSFSLLKDKHGLVVGGMDTAVYQDYEIVLSPGDKLFLYTDGVPEATAADMQMFTTDRMIEALNKEPDASPQKTLENVRQAVDDFVQNAEQFDDLTMLCLEYKGKA